MNIRADTVDLVEDVVTLCDRAVVIVHPRDSYALLDEEAFEREEFLPYWAELWPSAVQLAQAVAARPLAGRRVLELGCGLALPSIAAAIAGARVLATDWSPDAIEFAARNARRNGVAIETAAYSWADARPLANRGPWDLVLASDVLYERRNVELLVALLPSLVAEHGEVLLADPGRPHLAAFRERAANAWDITATGDPGASRVTLYSLRRHADAGG